MQRTLASIGRLIMQGAVAKNEWLTIEKEVSEAMLFATKEEIESFVDSGAGEILDMSCSAVRLMQNNL